MTKSCDAFLRLGLLNESREYGRMLEIMRLDSKRFYATQSSFFVLLIEVAAFYIEIPTNSRSFHAPSFYRLDEKLLQNLYYLYSDIKVL